MVEQMSVVDTSGVEPDVQWRWQVSCAWRRRRPINRPPDANQRSAPAVEDGLYRKCPRSSNEAADPPDHRDVAELAALPRGSLRSPAVELVDFHVALDHRPRAGRCLNALDADAASTADQARAASAAAGDAPRSPASRLPTRISS